MIQITDRIWVGDSDDAIHSDLSVNKITAILNVAQDLQVEGQGWGEGIEYAQVGLIDGPGNIQSIYCAAVLTLHTLVGRHKHMLVACHDGGRSLAVVLMYLILKKGKTSEHPTILNHWTTWDNMLLDLYKLGKHTQLPSVNDSHKEAFDKLPLSLLESLL